ncbi:hypothetical protein GOP47_0007805 [Adiantum capillus-veneris]|uniref:Uncharacterized protein n=1 Tax=Adiantum capillus-veneris TaxID=13818 RepID=A0A9D4ZLW2_ADICA|nr:hypothetical protein GOP47_0006944 [Adiantum capillus-veneris]KAI5077981.1 hypothetical protein GOP47_0007805 [Adiantum capillus-veneris]
MAAQELTPGDNCLLSNGAVQQLEHDGGNQQNDVQQVFSKQTSIGNGSNRLTRKLSRRTSGVEQDFNLGQKKLVDSERKLLDCEKENTKLQEELSEVNLFKNKLVDLLKREHEERAKLEKQQSVFQSQAFTAVFERDRLMLEVEKFQKKEDEMMEKLTDLQDRLDQVESLYTEGKSLCTNLQKELENSNQEVIVYRKVVEKFWRVRAKASEVHEPESTEERAVILLQDDEGYWSYGDLNKHHFDEATQARENLVNLQQEFEVCRNSLVNCQADHLEERSVRKQAENAVFEYRQQLVMLAEQSNSELQQLSSMRASLKEDVSGFLQEEMNWLRSLQDALHHIFREKMKVEGSEQKLASGCFKEPNDTCCSTEDLVIDESQNGGAENSTNVYNNDINANATHAKLDFSSMDDQDTAEVSVKGAREDELTKAVLTTCDEITNSTNRIWSVQEDNDVMQEDWSGKRDATVDECFTVPLDDSKEALAQALQEKVAALLLLSQQEERHILESNTTVVLESEIASLKQQLLQVTSEKVGALMELAQAHEELRKLQEAFKQTTQHGRTLSSGQLSPVEDYSVFFDNDKNSMAGESGKKASMQGYLKHLWLKGPELGARTKSLSHMLTLRSSKEPEAVGIARLKLENASMRESLTSIRHLCKSANRLRLTLARVAADSNAQTESSVQAAVEAVDSVISEALHLKVALHSSLPVDDLGWNSIGSPLARASEVNSESSDYDANDDLHIVSFFGLEIVRLVLLAAQLQKRFLGQNV